MQIAVSTNAREGDGPAKALALVGQAVAYLAQECVDSVIPNFQRLPLYQKIAINLAATVIPVSLGITGATVLSHKMESRVNQRRR